MSCGHKMRLLFLGNRPQLEWCELCGELRHDTVGHLVPESASEQPATEPEPEKLRLDTRPARPLTDRECAKIIGGSIFVMVELADRPETVKRALQWIVQNWDAYLSMFESLIRPKTQA